MTERQKSSPYSDGHDSPICPDISERDSQEVIWRARRKIAEYHAILERKQDELDAAIRARDRAAAQAAKAQTQLRAALGVISALEDRLAARGMT